MNLSIKPWFRAVLIPTFLVASAGAYAVEPIISSTQGMGAIIIPASVGTYFLPKTEALRREMRQLEDKTIPPMPKFERKRSRGPRSHP